MESQSFIEKYKITDRIIWICLVFFFWYLIVGDGFIGMPIEAFFKSLKVSDAMRFVFMYTQTICGWIAFFILCLFKKNRGDVLHDVLPKKKPNSFSKLLKGLLIGFLMNFACILCALIHGDIKLYFDFSPAGIPLMLFALFSVFIQSSCEEIWTRGFMYERINVHYPLWVAILINGTVFGLLHSFNDGITPLAMADLIFCGIGFSLLKWYTGSIWTAFGVHTAWNFTQNLIFGLPGEDRDTMLRSTEHVCEKDIFGIKFHMLNILKHTAIENMWSSGSVSLMTRDEYISLVCDALEIIPRNITIHRLTGDAPAELLLAPDWIPDKRAVLNGINSELKKRGSVQGCRLARI